MSTLYFLCPDTDVRHGGVKKLYRQVDVLNKHGFSAFVLHSQPGFRCSWFANQTAIAYRPMLQFDDTDFIVIPEVFSPEATQAYRGLRKVIFSQNAYYTFHNYPLDLTHFDTPYLDDEVVAAIVVSNDNRDTLSYIFPELPIYRIRYGIDPERFAFSTDKKPQIAFLPSKGLDDIRHVINSLKFRTVLDGYTLAPIENKTEAEVADILRDSSIFLWFTYQEGFGLLPAEAMLCGCVVIGFDGLNDGEFLRPEFCYPIPRGHVLRFAQTVEAVIGQLEAEPAVLQAKTQQAAEFIQTHYSLAIEEADIVQTWQAIANLPATPRPMTAAKQRYLHYHIAQRQTKVQHLEIEAFQAQLELEYFQSRLEDAP